MLALDAAHALVLTSKLPPGLRDVRDARGPAAPLPQDAALRLARRVRTSLGQTLATTANCVSLGTLDWGREPEPALVPMRLALFPRNQPLDELEWLQVATCMASVRLDNGDDTVRVELGDGRAETMVMVDARRLPARSSLTSLPGYDSAARPLTPARASQAANGIDARRGDDGSAARVARRGTFPQQQQRHVSRACARARAQREERAKHPLTEAGVVAHFASLGLCVGQVRPPRLCARAAH